MMSIPYEVSYSRRVREAFAVLVKSVVDAELVKQILAAATTLDYRLMIYPQFGEPLRDLSIKNAKLYIAVESPLVVKYILDEDRRQVLVGFPFQLMPGSARPSDESNEN